MYFVGGSHECSLAQTDGPAPKLRTHVQTENGINVRIFKHTGFYHERSTALVFFFRWLKYCLYISRKQILTLIQNHQCSQQCRHVYIMTTSVHHPFIYRRISSVRHFRNRQGVPIRPQCDGFTTSVFASSG